MSNAPTDSRQAAPALRAVAMAEPGSTPPCPPGPARGPGAGRRAAPSPPAAPQAAEPAPKPAPQPARARPRRPRPAVRSRAGPSGGRPAGAPGALPLPPLGARSRASRSWWCCRSPATSAYLYTRAADQYHSMTAFSVRSEEARRGRRRHPRRDHPARLAAPPPTSTCSSTSSAASRSSRSIDARLDLRAMFNREPDDDLVFSLGKDPSIEDLTDYWRRMVTVDLIQRRHHPGAGQRLHPRGRPRHRPGDPRRIRARW